MLIIEHTANGRTVVTLKRDWHPGRMGSRYTPPRRNYVDSREMLRVQSALLAQTFNLKTFKGNNHERS